MADISLSIVSGSKLPAMDVGGTSDPYVRYGWVKSADEKLNKETAHKTKVRIL